MDVPQDHLGSFQLLKASSANIYSLAFTNAIRDKHCPSMENLEGI